MGLEKASQPISIRNTVVSNRIVRTAHATNFGDGKITSEIIAYHALAAHSGVGLSILENASVHPSGPATLHNFDDSIISDYKALMRVLLPTDMKVFQQLGHPGYEVSPLNGDAPWSASALAGPNLGVQAEAMTEDQINELISSFTFAALRCQQGGLHGVEIHGAHGHLLQQFLSSKTNFREDEYGGKFVNRLRFLKEILESIRSAVDEDFIVGLRLGAEAIDGGMAADDIAKVAAHLQQGKCIDYISLSYGSAHALEKIMGTFYEVPGYELQAARPVKEIAKVPVIVTGRFRSIIEVNEVLQNGQADLVGMTRAHIADPELLSKTRDNKIKQIRPCIATNQGCVAGIARGRMSCMVNPLVGRESEMEQLMLPALVRKRILIIGAGPAGMEAARVAGLRGHDVSIMEAAENCGGAFYLASKFPGTGLFREFIQWQEDELSRLKVNVKYGLTVDAAIIKKYDADEIIIATGSKNKLPKNIPGIDKANIRFVEELISKPGIVAGDKVVVYDETGRYQAIATCERLFELGAEVSYITNRNRFASRMTASLVSLAALKRFTKESFVTYLDMQVEEIDEHSILARSLIDDSIVKLEMNCLVFVNENESRQDLMSEAGLQKSTVHIIGDADKVGDLQSAIKQGFDTAASL
ncbi:MAG: 2,4-dienoyl-CoA reductase-like NADH-dependent reductase (Old Yellow Enzyme family) [Gammaproteobacteria bacterium]|jgi:2,4-dienoyl-CoA reductase-like NADH-dependent reductase (Old Yellow Enzyme family)/thioredoxin reductase